MVETITRTNLVHRPDVRVCVAIVGFQLIAQDGIGRALIDGLSGGDLDRFHLRSQPQDSAGNFTDDDRHKQPGQCQQRLDKSPFAIVSGRLVALAPRAGFLTVCGASPGSAFQSSFGHSTSAPMVPIARGSTAIPAVAAVGNQNGPQSQFHFAACHASSADQGRSPVGSRERPTSPTSPDGHNEYLGRMAGYTTA